MARNLCQSQIFLIGLIDEELQGMCVRTLNIGVTLRHLT